MPPTLKSVVIGKFSLPTQDYIGQKIVQRKDTKTGFRYVQDRHPSLHFFSKQNTSTHNKERNDKVPDTD